MNNIYTIIFFFPSFCFSQYFTSAQINSVKTSSTASEGDLYLDTINNNYFIGLSNGDLAKIGDTLDELIDSITYVNDSLIIYQADSEFMIFIPNIYNTNGTLSSRRIVEANNNTLILDNIDSLDITADTIYFNKIPVKSDTVLNYINISNKNNHLNKVSKTIEYFYSLTGNTIILSNAVITGNSMIKLYYNGQLLYKNRDYNISGFTITLLFNEIKSSDAIIVEYHHN